MKEEVKETKYIHKETKEKERKEEESNSNSQKKGREGREDNKPQTHTHKTIKSRELNPHLTDNFCEQK